MEIYNNGNVDRENILLFSRNELQDLVGVNYYTLDDTSDDDIDEYDANNNIAKIDEYMYGTELPSLNLDSIKYVTINNFYLIPLTPTGVIDTDDIEELYNMSDDFAENNRELTFWYLTHFGEIIAVFRHSELFA